MVVFLFIYLWPPFGFLDRIGSYFLLLGLQSCVCSQRLPSFLKVYLVKKENEDCIMLTSVMLLLFGALSNKSDFGGEETTYTL
jgi:lipoprotein signal peptidase